MLLRPYRCEQLTLAHNVTGSIGVPRNQSTRQSGGHSRSPRTPPLAFDKSVTRATNAGLGARANHCRLWGRDNLLFAVGLTLSGLPTFANVDAALEVGAILN
jgi:hypothetical protein